MKDLHQLNDKVFDIDKVPDTNLDKLIDYISDSTKYKAAKEEDVVIHV